MLISNVLLAQFLLCSQDPINHPIGGSWRNGGGLNKPSKNWQDIEIEVNKKIAFLKKDSQNGRTQKLETFASEKYDIEDDMYSFTCAKYLLEFKPELNKLGLSSKLIYRLSNSAGNRDAMFVRAGYSALNLAQQSNNWTESLESSLLSYFPNDIKLKKAYVYSGIYSSSDEKRITKSLDLAQTIRRSWSDSDYQSVRAAIYDKLYLRFKRKSYLTNCIASYEAFIEGSSDASRVGIAKRYLNERKDQLARKDYID